jgi:hypothetical protein
MNHPATLPTRLPSRPARAAARRSNSAARSPRSPSAATAAAPSCATATRSRASARWRRCSRTSARCSCWRAGRWQNRAFTLVGRLQYRGPAAPGPNGTRCSTTAAPAWLAEDNGAYVIALPATLERARPRRDRSRCVGATTAFDGQELHRQQQRAGRAGLGAGRTAQAAAAGAAVRGRRTAQRRRRGAGHRLRQRAAGAVTRGRPVASRNCSSPACADESGQGGEGPPVRLPQLRRAGRSQAGRSKSITCRAATA